MENNKKYYVWYTHLLERKTNMHIFQKLKNEIRKFQFQQYDLHMP